MVASNKKSILICSTFSQFPFSVKKHQSWQVWNSLAKWLIVLGFMDLMWPRVFRCSNVGLGKIMGERGWERGGGVHCKYITVKYTKYIVKYQSMVSHSSVLIGALAFGWLAIMSLCYLIPFVWFGRHLGQTPDWRNVEKNFFYNSVKSRAGYWRMDGRPQGLVENRASYPRKWVIIVEYTGKVVQVP